MPLWLSPIIAVLVCVTLLGGVALMLFGRGQILEAWFGKLEYPAIDFPALQKTGKPNQYLVCPPGHEIAGCDSISPEFAISPTELRDHWQTVMAAQPRLTIVAAEQLSGGATQDEWQQTYVQRSRIAAFPDLITVRFERLAPDRSALWIYSRSVYGHSDLGVNKRRVTRWLAALQTQIGSAASPADAGS